MSKQTVTYNAMPKSCPTRDMVFVDLNLSINFRIGPDIDRVLRILSCAGDGVALIKKLPAAVQGGCMLSYDQNNSNPCDGLDRGSPCAVGGLSGKCRFLW